MGILDKVNNSENSSSENSEEVTINPVPEETSDEKESSRLKNQAEKELTDSDGVTLEEVHRQNERIIEMLEELTGNEKENEEPTGGLDGVL